MNRLIRMQEKKSVTHTPNRTDSVWSGTIPGGHTRIGDSNRSWHRRLSFHIEITETLSRERGAIRYLCGIRAIKPFYSSITKPRDTMQHSVLVLT